eukprot:scaffold16056_cov147-Skeletonema_menzelii.AAC.4
MTTASESTLRRTRQGATLRQRSRCTSTTCCVVALAVLVMPHRWQMSTSPQTSCASPESLKPKPGVMQTNFVVASMGCHQVRDSRKAAIFFAHASPIVHQRMLQATTISPAPSVSILTSIPSMGPSSQPTIDLSVSPSSEPTTTPSLKPSPLPSYIAHNDSKL